MTKSNEQASFNYALKLCSLATNTVHTTYTSLTLNFCGQVIIIILETNSFQLHQRGSCFCVSDNLLSDPDTILALNLLVGGEKEIDLFLGCVSQFFQGSYTNLSHMGGSIQWCIGRCSFTLGARVNCHPLLHDERWMMCGQETLFHCILVPQWLAIYCLSTILMYHQPNEKFSSKGCY